MYLIITKHWQHTIADNVGMPCWQTVQRTAILCQISIATWTNSALAVADSDWQRKNIETGILQVYPFPAVSSLYLRDFTEQDTILYLMQTFIACISCTESNVKLVLVVKKFPMNFKICYVKMYLFIFKLHSHEYVDLPVWNSELYSTLWITYDFRGHPY